MSIQRVLQGSTVQLNQVLVDGYGQVVPPSVDSVSVTITAADGTILGTGIPGTPTGNDGEFWVTLDSTMTALLDELTVAWTHVGTSTTTTTVEIVGGFLFDLADLQALLPSVQTQAKLIETRTAVEDALESELGYALVPRYIERTFQARSSALRLGSYVRAIRYVTVAGTALTASQISSLLVDAAGMTTGYAWTRGPIRIGYERGLDAPPPRARDAGLQLAKAWITKGPIDDRTTSFTSEVGITSTFAIPGRGGSIFGLPAVDQYVIANRLLIGA